MQETPFRCNTDRMEEKGGKYTYGELALMHARCCYGVSQQAFPE
jgi:hypothetical protein